MSKTTDVWQQFVQICVTFTESVAVNSNRENIVATRCQQKEGMGSCWMGPSNMQLPVRKRDHINTI